MSKVINDPKTSQPVHQPQAALPTRSRRPQGLKNNHALSAKETASAVTPVAATDLNNDLNDATLAQNGYATGNAQFLHIQIENNGTGDTLELYAYNYNFGSWAKYYLPLGIKNGGDTTTNLAYVEAKWTTINGKFMVTVPIHGVDRVGFVHDGSLGNMVVRAAVSTF